MSGVYEACFQVESGLAVELRHPLLEELPLRAELNELSAGAVRNDPSRPC